MSKRKIAYARKNVIDPEEEGEELPFEPREIIIHTDYWFDRDYELHDQLLGRGKFGEVKKCSERSSGLILAAKIVTARKEKEKGEVRKEINIMSQLRHPKILQIYDAFESSRKMCIITELVEGGELFDRVVDENFDLTERVAILFMRQIIDGIAFIHSQNILHLDMKPENIICVAKTGTRIKIIDFGLAMRYDSNTRVMAGTVDFMSPEVCNYEEVSPATDMWSIGVICYVLVSGLSPFCGDDDSDTICNILKVDFDFAAEEFDEVTAGCKDFIKKLLIKNPRKRMTAVECMKHSWLNKITRSQTNKHLSKKHHIRFFVKRKWKKVIKAVIALNRFTRFARERREASESRTLIPEPKAVKNFEIPDWKVKMEERINKGMTKAEMPENENYNVRSSTTPRAAPSGPVKSSLSCSSGYDSSGSARSTATIDEIPLVSKNKLDKLYSDSDDIVAFQRLESVETLVNDECDAKTGVPIENQADVVSVPHTQDNSIISRSEADVTEQNTLRQEGKPDDSTNESSEGDEVYNFYSDTEDEVNDSNGLNSHPVDKLEVADGTKSEHSNQTNDYGQRSTKEVIEDSSKQTAEDVGCEEKSPSDLFHGTPSGSLSSCNTQDESSNSPSGGYSGSSSRLRRRRASLLDDVIEISEEPIPTDKVRTRTRRSSGLQSGHIQEILMPRSSSPSAGEGGHLSRPDLPRYDRSRKPSIEIGKIGMSSLPVQPTKRVSSPSTRYSRSSRNNSREPSIDQDSDDITPVGRRHHWSPSPVRELNSGGQMKIRIAAHGGNDYVTSITHVYDPTERIIPIEVEHSPPRSSRLSSLPRQVSGPSTRSESLTIARTPPSDHGLCSRWSSHPAIDSEDIYSAPYCVRDSPVHDSSPFLNRVRDSPGRSGFERRQARIAAIMADSTESLDEIDKRKASASSANSRTYSGSSTDNRQARIAAVVGNSDYGRQENSRPSSRPSSRNNSDDNRHRRIAAILSQSDNS